MDWLRQTTKILNLNRLSGCRSEPRTTKHESSYHSTGTSDMPVLTAAMVPLTPTLPHVVSKGDIPLENYPGCWWRITVHICIPDSTSALPPWSAALCQQCMRAFPGSCHHVTKTDRNICRWLWRLCGGKGWWFTGCFLKGLLWHNLRPDARIIPVPWPFLSYEAVRHTKCCPHAFAQYPIGFL